MEQENVKVGDTIKILWVDDCGYDTVVNSYIGREGIVQFIDSIGQLHGTWGGLAIIPDTDKFKVINNNENK